MQARLLQGWRDVPAADIGAVVDTLMAVSQLLATEPRIAEIDFPEEAYTFSVDFSRSHCNLYNTGIVKITPETNMQFCEDIRVVMHNRKFFGHHDGGGLGGKKKTMLLPSGIVVSGCGVNAGDDDPRMTADAYGDGSCG